MTDEQIAASSDFANVWAALLASLPDDYACHLTCIEAESAARFLRAWGLDDAAQSVIQAHTTYDVHGDMHYHDGGS